MALYQTSGRLLQLARTLSIVEQRLCAQLISFHKTQFFARCSPTDKPFSFIASTTSSACTIGTLSSMLPCTIKVGTLGCGALPFLIAGATLNSVGSIPVPLRRRSSRIPLQLFRSDQAVYSNEYDLLLNHVMVEDSSRAVMRRLRGNRLLGVKILRELFLLYDSRPVRYWMLLCVPEAGRGCVILSISISSICHSNATYGSFRSEIG